MVGLMKFSLDFCRLLGLSGSSDERPEEMDTGALPEQNDHTLSQVQEQWALFPELARDDVLNGEEGLSEEEKARRKAERRKAKRKRQRQRKKLERGKKDESTEQGEENAGADSELDESEESESEEVECIGLSKVEEKPVAPHSKSPFGPPLASGNKSNQQPAARASEEDPGWDVNSAFVANAVSHIRPKAKSKGAHKSKENKENESRTGEVIGLPDAKTKRSALLVVEHKRSSWRGKQI